MEDDVALFERPRSPEIPGPDDDLTRIQSRVANAVTFEKSEAFAMCEVLAIAERALVRSGHTREAANIGLVFEAIENRLLRPLAGSDEAQPEGGGGRPATT
jgi:hypothetical protein